MTDPVEIVPFGRADVRSFRWAHAGQERITLAARASFEVRDDETTRLVDPDPLRQSTAVGDLVPFRDRADVLVFGDPALHPDRVPLTIHGDTSLLDTTAPVLADRGSRATVPETLAVPEDADWSAYQEAPPAQQTALIQGGERLVAGPIRGRIPRTRGVVYVADAGAPKEQGDRIEMDLDAIHVDLDRRVCSLVYRTVFLLGAADELDGRTLHVGIEPEDEDEEAARATRTASTVRAFVEGGSSDAAGPAYLDPVAARDASTSDASDPALPAADAPHPATMHAEDLRRLGDRTAWPNDPRGPAVLSGDAARQAAQAFEGFGPSADRAALPNDPRAAAPLTARAPSTATSEDPWSLAERRERPEDALLHPAAGQQGGSFAMSLGPAGASDPMAAAAFTAGAATERAFPTAAGDASAMSSEDQPGVRIRRSKPATAAPTPPGTAGVRRALYERFRP